MSLFRYWWCYLVALSVVMGIVLSPLRAVAATIPVLAAFDEAARPTATTVLGEHDAVPPEAAHPSINVYDAASLGYDDPSNARVGAGTGAFHPYDDDPEHADRREVRSEGALYDAPAAVPAAEGGEALAQGVASDAKLFQAYRAELAQQEIQGADAVGSALKSDPYHLSASFVTDTIAADGKVFSLANRTGTVNLTQVLGEMNGTAGRFEWIVDGSGNLTHQMFVGGGGITGVPIVP